MTILSKGFSVLVPAGLFLLTAPLMAQTVTIAPSHQQAARDLYRKVGGADTAEAASDAMLSAMTSSNPAMAEYDYVLRKWLKMVFSDATFESEIANVYAAFFTEQEIRELIAFYNTPLGQKSLKKLPEIMKQGAMIGAKHAEAHTGELKSMLMEAMKEKHPERFKAEEGNTKTGEASSEKE